MRLRIAAIATLLMCVPAFADCTDDTCSSIEKILQARSRNFAKIQGKPALDPRGDPVWQGTQPIGGLITYCYINKRGEGARYEYRCESQSSSELDKSKQIAAAVKAAFKSVEPNIEWFDDPAAVQLGQLDGFRGTEGWYGGFIKNKTVIVKIETVASGNFGSVTSVTVFAKPLLRRDLR